MRRTWRSAWIIGASHGIGRELALQLARQGTAVIASARSADALEQLQAEAAGITPLPLDATDHSALARAAVTIERQQGALDLLICNAGIYQPLPSGLADPQIFRQHIEVNYLGTVNGLMAVLPAMRARHAGQVAIVASPAGYRGLPQAAAYGPSKAALISLAETLRLELHGSGVDLRLINPGFVATRLTAKNRFHMPALLSADEAARRILRGLQGNAFEIAFPWTFVSWLKLTRLLPYRWYFPLMNRLTRQ
jgi:short-subunit dehydrogenase